jgi:hypothetical protein
VQDFAQQKPESLDEAAEVVAGGGEDGVSRIAFTLSEEVAAHARAVLAMADHRFDSGAAFELALDGLCDALLLALGVQLPDAKPTVTAREEFCIGSIRPNTRQHSRARRSSNKLGGKTPVRKGWRTRTSPPANLQDSDIEPRPKFVAIGRIFFR